MEQENSHKARMLRGEEYDPLDPQLTAERTKARQVLHKFNNSRPTELRLRRSLLKELMPAQGAGLWIEPPFQCDYGYNIRTGEKVFMNFNCVILDVATVEIGHHVLIGPAVQIYTAMHPMDWTARSQAIESAKPVTIGDYVWIGGAVVVCPGVTIGARSVIGAGSVVTRNIPPDVFAAGNPCRIIRNLAEAGSGHGV